MRFARVLQVLIFACLVALLLAFCCDIECVKLMPKAAPDSLFGLPTGDFANLWSAGRLSRAGHLRVLYASDAFTGWKQMQFGHAVLRDDWIYPPLVLPLGAVISLLPIPAGFLLWNAGTMAAMVWLLRFAGLGWGAVLLGVTCPAEWLCLIYGQYGGIISCLVFTGLVLGARRPVAAGIMLGLVTCKPQTGLLVPAAWLASRRWRAIATSCAVTAVLAVLPVLCFGPASWSLFLTRSRTMAVALVQAKFGQGYQLTGTSVFWMLRSFGMAVPGAYAGQIVAACFAGFAVFCLWRKPGDVLRQASLTMFLSLFVAPYGFSVDMVGYSVALAVLAQRRGWRVNLFDGLLWLWPGYAAIVTHSTGVLLTPIVVGIAALSAWRELRRRDEPAPGERIRHAGCAGQRERQAF